LGRVAGRVSANAVPRRSGSTVTASWSTARGFPGRCVQPMRNSAFRRSRGEGNVRSCRQPTVEMTTGTHVRCFRRVHLCSGRQSGRRSPQRTHVSTVTIRSMYRDRRRRRAVRRSSDGLRDLAAAQTARAHEEVPSGAADAGADALEVRTPHALRLVVRVTHVVPDRALLAADLTCARHGGREVPWAGAPGKWGAFKRRGGCAG
jgi:hypothetical protein